MWSMSTPVLVSRWGAPPIERSGHPAPDGRCRECVERRREDESGRDGVRFERIVDVTDGLGACARDGGGNEEVRPVIVQRFRLEIWIAGRHLEAPQLRGERHVPHEVGGEVCAVVATPLGIGRTKVVIRHGHQ